MTLEILQTADGSHTLFVPELNEHYHSTYGAIQESRHIFIEAGFRQIPINQPVVRILEVGFGTGLNAFLSLLEADKSGKTIHYTAIEPFPLDPAIIKLLNYAELLGASTESLFKMLHEADWNRKIQITDHFILHKVLHKLKNIELLRSSFDIVYFDAFGPEVQPELWTEEIFRKIFSSMKEKGILVTYSAKGSIRRALKNSGFSVEKLPGPAGKREITRAIKNGDKQV
jgi:tRNA U34 5-methylaminomethyl-2-thiouridine-forming methyltransferase MnmC